MIATVAEQLVGVHEAEHRAREEAQHQKHQNAGQVQAPREPLRSNAQDDDASESDEKVFDGS
jgi:hypothetical protein